MTRRCLWVMWVSVVGWGLSGCAGPGERPPSPSLNRPTSQGQQDRRPPQNVEEQVKELEKDVDDALKEEARTICAQRAPYFANVQAACERREYQLLKQRSKERAP
ncbi:MAG: hypothetical protein KGO52_08195 [Nitrospirota bacterium]|nr:hypothetical protein [Nitrospirota bacterium]MDE3242679.1 hypothetical protein [Nitrospirota bacterium]